MFIKQKLMSLGHRGDTIVEVMIAVAVISSVLGGAYITTNKSLQATRDAQERANATKLVESQLEQLKQVVASDSGAVFGASAATSGYCVYHGSVDLVSSGHCNVDSNGTPTATEPVYHLSISRTGNVFKVANTWSHIGSGATNKVEMGYKLYAQ
jgi:Tfp pilus assembly protein PilV